jgi:hypothetical protein
VAAPIMTTAKLTKTACLIIILAIAGNISLLRA